MIASRYFARLGGGALALIAAVGWQTAGRAQDDGALAIELNKLESTEQGCRSSFLVDNQTGHQLSRFQLDLVLFDPDGVAAKQVVLDMAPLYADKKLLTSFLLDAASCDKIGSILINSVPMCENGAGNAVDCVGLLEVRSRSEVPLEK
jgi:hypothetical protein